MEAADHQQEITACRGITTRAIAIALGLLVLIAPAAFYAELVYGIVYTFATGMPAMAPLVILFLLTLLNLPARRIGLNPLSRGELLSVYGIVLVGAPLVSHGILAWMLPFNLIQRYLVRAFPQWEPTYFQYIPSWFAPTDMASVEGYFRGGASVLWARWAIPLSAWSSYLIALSLASLFAVVIVRRQWITNERLTFPLAQVPLETVQTLPDGAAGRLPTGSLFRVGLAVPIAFGLVNGLSRYFPSIPSLPLVGPVLVPHVITGPWAGVGDIILDIDFPLIALAYLIPKELSFSCWFFWFVRVALTVSAIAAGAAPLVPEGWSTSAFPAPYHQGGGAVLALGVWVLWSGRRHLLRAVRIAFGIEGNESDAGEPMTYRWALLGFALCIGYLVCFCTMMGVRPLVGLAIMALIVSYYVMWARLRAETGLGFLAFPMRPNIAMLMPFGSAVYRPSELLALLSLRWSYSPGFGVTLDVCTGNSLETLKIADSARITSRPLFRAILAGFLLSLGIGIYVVMTGMYHYGFSNIRAASSGWLGSQLRYMGDYIYETIGTPTPPDPNGVIAIGAGAVVAIVLSLLRMRLWWWPLHPAGYLAANCWGMHWYWMPLFIGWLWKTLTIRYGGLRLYRSLVPLAIGLLMGAMVSEGVWTAVNLLTGQKA